VDSSFRLGCCDVMLLYTDGVTEMRNSAGEQFGIDRLCAELERVHDVRRRRSRNTCFSRSGRGALPRTT
jgi:serine phosphatase RsbU (regulator of sigma subunit)